MPLDDPRTTHADVMRVLRLARESIIAGIMDGDQRRSWRERFAQALRALCSGSVVETCTALRFEARGPASSAGGPAPVAYQRAAPSRAFSENTSVTREVCEAP